MPILYLRLSTRLAQRLEKVARQQVRTPAEQAIFIIMEALPPEESGKPDTITQDRPE